LTKNNFTKEQINFNILNVIWGYSMGSLVAMYVLVGIICIAIIGAIFALEKIREQDEEK
jgi:uncharacterized membrane protein YciS (DUF1049 family)